MWPWACLSSLGCSFLISIIRKPPGSFAVLSFYNCLSAPNIDKELGDFSCMQTICLSGSAVPMRISNCLLGLGDWYSWETSLSQDKSTGSYPSGAKQGLPLGYVSEAAS